MNTPPRRSGMARVLNGSHSFTCTPRVHPPTEWTIPAFVFPAEACSHYRPRRERKLSWPGWLVTYRDRCPAPGIEPVTHPSTNRTRRMLTSLIKSNALPLRRTTSTYCARSTSVQSTSRPCGLSAILFVFRHPAPRDKKCLICRYNVLTVCGTGPSTRCSPSVMRLVSIAWRWAGTAEMLVTRWTLSLPLTGWCSALRTSTTTCVRMRVVRSVVARAGGFTGAVPAASAWTLLEAGQHKLVAVASSLKTCKPVACWSKSTSPDSAKYQQEQ